MDSSSALQYGSRRDDLDVARAIAALAVVLHHVCQYSARYDMPFLSPTFISYCVEAVRFIHLPTFMLVAGFVQAMKGRPVRTVADYVRFERKKVCRLMLPFVAISLLHLLVKFVAPGEYLSGFSSVISRTLMTPHGGLAGHLWFLYCLMSIFLIWPLLAPVAQGRGVSLLFVGLFLLAVLPVPWPARQFGLEVSRPLFGLNELAWYLPIFTLGFWYGGRPIGQRRPMPVAILVAGAFSVGAFFVCRLASWPDDLQWRLLCNCIRMAGYVSTALFVYWLSGRITSGLKVGDALAGVGRRSYDIYLLHVALVGHPLVFVASRLRLGQFMAYVLFAVILCLTYILPIGIGQLVRRVPQLAFVMLGVPYASRPRTTGSGEKG